MPPIDTLFAVILLVGMPLIGFLLDRGFEAKFGLTPKSDEVRIALRNTHIFLWGGCAIAIAAWVAAGGRVVSIGLGWNSLPDVTGWDPMIGWVIALGLCLGQGSVLMIAFIKPSAVVNALDDLAQTNLLPFMPNTPADMRRWVFTSFTAGFTEEVIWRGFCILALLQVMPLWAAALLSLISFTLGHIYQSGAGLIRVVLIAVALMTIAALSRSLIPAMLLHFIIDLTAGGVAYNALKAKKALESSMQTLPAQEGL